MPGAELRAFCFRGPRVLGFAVLIASGVYSHGIHPYLSRGSQRRPMPVRARLLPIRRTFRRIMRPEIQTQLDNAKQSIGLLRRHL